MDELDRLAASDAELEELERKPRKPRKRKKARKTESQRRSGKPRDELGRFTKQKKKTA